MPSPLDAGPFHDGRVTPSREGFVAEFVDHISYVRWTIIAYVLTTLNIDKASGEAGQMLEPR